MKSSGYPRKTVKEAVVSGLKGWKNKIDRRKKEGISFYRAAKSTLKGRAARNFYKEKTGLGRMAIRKMT